ncbi:MAG: ferrous iron transport protein B [Microbacter sp.]
MVTNIRTIPLSEMKTGEEGIIFKVLGRGAFRKRITEMGFVKGKKVKVIKNAPLQDPVEYELLGYNVSLRRSEAALVQMVTMEDGAEWEGPSYNGMIDEESLKISAQEKSRNIHLALVGNPNCGKTTLFNHASGSHEHVGNYSGVTVDAKEAMMEHRGYTFQWVDLPGTYSITEYSPEELYVRNYIMDKMPDIVVNVVDASNLERNLFLTTQLIDMNIKVVIALNMYDELEKKGAQFDYDALGKMLGIPIIPTIASKGIGVTELLDKLIEVYEDRDSNVRHVHINYGADIEEAIKSIQDEIWKNPSLTDQVSSRYLAIKLLEQDKTTLNKLASCCKNFSQIESTMYLAIQRLEKEYGEKSETIIADAKYGFIDGALKETYHEAVKDKRKVKHELDDFLTHRFWGFPIFIFFMWVMFQATFSIGKYPMDWIGDGVSWVSNMTQQMIAPGPLRDLLVDGIIAGIGSVIVFLPNILILFFFISIMEDTGYMARASFIMDKLMHKIGLHGKSFIPLLMGFGCNVPAIMATRTLENRKDRILTMMIIPFMSCSARLPVYVLLISAFFAAYQGLVLFSIYMIGVLLAIVVALMLKKIVLKKQEAPFVMELPPYRMPTLKNTSVHMWFKAKQYLRKMGSVILIASILLWVLGYFPRHDVKDHAFDHQLAQISDNPQISPIQKTKLLDSLMYAKEAARQENSYIGRIGHAIQPIMSPLGFDWKMSVSLLSGFAAKEIVVSSMGVLYQAGAHAEEHSQTLKYQLIHEKHQSGPLKGKPVFTPLVAIGFLLFVLIYFPCIATVAAINREAGWRWALFSMTFTTLLAWLVAFLTFQIGSLFT